MQSRGKHSSEVCRVLRLALVCHVGALFGTFAPAPSPVPRALLLSALHRRFCLGLPAPTCRLNQPMPTSLAALLTAIPFALWPACFLSPSPGGIPVILRSQELGKCMGRCHRCTVLRRSLCATRQRGLSCSSAALLAVVCVHWELSCLYIGQRLSQPQPFALCT